MYTYIIIHVYYIHILILILIFFNIQIIHIFVKVYHVLKHNGYVKNVFVEQYSNMILPF